jgi:hypothetical protein
MNGTFGFLTIWDDNKVDVVSTAIAIEISSSTWNYVTRFFLSSRSGGRG